MTVPNSEDKPPEIGPFPLLMFPDCFLHNPRFYPPHCTMPGSTHGRCRGTGDLSRRIFRLHAAQATVRSMEVPGRNRHLRRWRGLPKGAVWLSGLHPCSQYGSLERSRRRAPTYTGPGVGSISSNHLHGVLRLRNGTGSDFCGKMERWKDGRFDVWMWP